MCIRDRVEIAPPSDPDLYDFWSQEAMVRGQNFPGWNNRRAVSYTHLTLPKSDRV